MNSGPIYIGGPDRCGKTTMQAFLTSHPRIAIPNVGSNMWTYFYGQYGDLSRRENFERCLEAMLHYKHIRFLEPNPERIRQEFWLGEPTYARLFELFLIHFAERSGKPRWGVQTGYIERYADHLFAAYPGVKVIHMIRDPRDRYEASLARWPNGKGRVGGATARWLYSVELARRNQQRYSDRYKIVRYETLVSQPEETLREVCAFLDETFVPSMLTMDSAPNQRNRLLDGSHISEGQAPVSTEFIGLFRERIPSGEIAFMQMYAKSEMLAHNYALEPLSFSIKDWLHFALVDWPLNLIRMSAWRTIEAVQQKFPGPFGRKPGRRMIVGTEYTDRRKSTTA